MAKKINGLFSSAIILCLGLCVTSDALCAQEDFKTSPHELNFGHEAVEKTVSLTNATPDRDVFWSVKTDVPWLTVEPPQGKIDNPSRLPADAPYHFSNMWPQLPQPYYFKGATSVGIDHEGSVYVINPARGRVMKFNKYMEFVFELGREFDKFEVFNKENDFSHIAFDAQNNFYLTNGSREIKKFDKYGKFMTTIATPLRGLGGPLEFGPSFTDIALDSKGNIYATGTVGIINAASYVYVFDANGVLLRNWKINDFFGSPTGIVIDSKDHVYVADNYYKRVRKFDANGNVLKRWGDDVHTFSEDKSGAFAIDSEDKIYVARYVAREFSNVFTKLDAELKETPVSWVSDFRWPLGVGDAALDKEGNSYLCVPEKRGSLIKFDHQGKLLVEWAQQEQDPKPQLIEYRGLAVSPQGDIYVRDSFNRIQIFDAEGRSGGLLRLESGFSTRTNYRETVAVDRNGVVYTSGWVYVSPEDTSYRVIKLDRTGNQSALLGKFGLPIEKAIFDSQNNLYVLQFFGRWLTKLDQTGKVVQNLDLREIEGPAIYDDVAIDSQDNIYITSSENVLKINPDGRLVQRIAYARHVNENTGDSSKAFLAIDTADHLYVSLGAYNEIQKFDSNGRFLGVWGKRGSGEGEFSGPAGIVVGPNNRVYVLDSGNDRVVVFSQAAQQVKMTIDRSQLTAATNTGWMEFSNDLERTQPPIRIQVTALSDTIAPPAPPTTPPSQSSPFFRTIPRKDLPPPTFTQQKTPSTISRTKPVVWFVSPKPNATVKASESVSLRATAVDADGKIATVEFFQTFENRTSPLGSGQGPSANFSYLLDWKPTVPGTYTLVAKGTDNDGNVGESRPLTIEVSASSQANSPAQVLRASALPRESDGTAVPPRPAAAESGGVTFPTLQTKPAGGSDLSSAPPRRAPKRLWRHWSWLTRR